MTRALLVLVPALMTLTACAEAGDYPSLARRPAERVSGIADPVAPESGASAPLSALLPAPDTTVVARLDRLVSDAGAAHQRFLAEQARTRRLVAAASGGAVASESWSVATVALAALDSARGGAMIAMGDLDAMLVADRIANVGEQGAESAAIQNAHDRVSALISEEDSALAALRSQLRES